MPNHYEIRKPQPDPWGNAFVLTQPGTITIFTSQGVLVIDRKTGEIIREVPEMPIPGEYGYAVATAASVLHNTKGLKGVEGLRSQTAKFLVSMAETVAVQVEPSMPNLKPDPNPWGNAFVLTQPGTITIFTSQGVLVIDRKTGEIIREVPEMPIPGEYGYAFTMAASLLHNTKDLKGAEDLRLQTAKFLVSVIEIMATKII